jgi:hypothetical protein
MTRLPLLALALVLFGAALATAQAPNVVTRESTMTAKVERIERSIRVVTLRTDDNVRQQVYVDPSIAEFNDLKVGDVVTVRYAESVVVQVRNRAKPSDVTDTTEDARKKGNPQVVQQLTTVVTVEDVDSQGLSITYRTEDGRKMTYAVIDKKLVAGLHRGDKIQVTLTRERAIAINRDRR